MNKRQKGLTSVGTFLGLVCGFVLTQQVIYADTNSTASQTQNIQATVTSTSTGSLSRTADSDNDQTPVVSQSSFANDNNNTASSLSDTSADTVESNNSGSFNNAVQPVADTATTSDSSTPDVTTDPVSSEPVTSGVWGTSAWDLVQNDADYTLNFHAGNLGSGSISDNVLSNNADWITGLTTINFDSGVVANKDSSYLFHNLRDLAQLNLSNLDTSNVTNMNHMFSMDNYSHLVSLDLNNFDTSNVTDMSSMFAGAMSLTGLDLSNFDTSNVTNMSSMFSIGKNLKNLDLSSFDTSHVTNMAYMFNGDRCLTGLDLSGFDTSHVTNMAYMFSGDRSLISLNLSNFDTSDVTDMRAMFYGNSALTNLDISNFDTSHVLLMPNMFASDSNLTTLDLSSFDTSNTTNMIAMFSNDSSLTSLDLSNFNTSQLHSMDSMFQGDSSLTSLDLSSFDISKFTNIYYIFSGDYGLSHLVLGPKTYLNANVDMPDVPPVGTLIPETNKVVTSTNWVSTSGYQQGQKYSSQDLMNLIGRDQVTVYDWDSTEPITTEFHTVTRTINIHQPDGTLQVKTQYALVMRNKILNSDGTISYDSWTSAQWPGFTVPEFDDYQTSQTKVPTVTVDGNTADQTVDIYYTPICHNLVINYVDQDGSTVGYQKYSVSNGVTITPQYNIPAGYKLASVPPTSVQMDNVDQIINVSVSHIIDFSYEQHSITRIINLHQPNAQIQSIKQYVTLRRSVETDRVTGTRTYGQWSVGNWNEYDVPMLDGYMPSQLTVAAMPITIYTPDQLIDIYYTHN
ncbi:BspA family leucine-rich repeat surface protein [Bombilactobacillus thymidiniphilus]|uniref:DUF285 domain-containing protein n=1 Tax=Bombilactobacillus thymidiniphilus TaxID=2923363 RepID=A0ABY4PBV2_9LACO|nr:BspA family leucine-rich repeat surface protein [Bombilactobacillus thymidiniphilus]UQS83156.1 DUF285 domain-containing protein [Bombilactobacillus thymidiniphilus]